MNTAVQGVGARRPSVLVEMGRRTNQPKRLLPHGGGTRFQRTDKSAIRDFRRGCQMRLQHDAMPHAPCPMLARSRDICARSNSVRFSDLLGVVLNHESGISPPLSLS